MSWSQRGWPSKDNRTKHSCEPGPSSGRGGRIGPSLPPRGARGGVYPGPGRPGPRTQRPGPGGPGGPRPISPASLPSGCGAHRGRSGETGPRPGRAGTSTAGARPRPNVPPRRGVGVPANCSPIAAPAAGAARQSGRPGPAPLARLPSAGFALQSGSRGRLPKHEEDTCCGPGHLEGEAASRGGGGGGECGACPLRDSP